MAGYSITGLAKKLGYKEDFLVKLIHEPKNYFEMLSDLPQNVNFQSNAKQKIDLIHIFAKESKKLFELLIKSKSEIKQNGMIWVSWPKKSSKVETDITETIIREFAIHNGLVDIKVCAVDEIWSGLKLVIPIKNRK